MRLILQSAFDVYSGYGCDAVDLAVNLEKAGVDVTLYPTAVLPGLPRQFTRLLEKDPGGKKDVLLRFCPPPEAEAWVMRGKVPKQILYTMWERTPIAASELTQNPKRPDDEPDGLNGWDGLVVTCPMNREAFAPVYDGDIAVVPCGIEPDAWPVHEKRRQDDRPLTFLMLGMMAGRKNPFAFLDAWEQVKRDYPDFDAKLRIHNLAAGGVHPRVGEVYRDVEVSTQPIPRGKVHEVYHAADVLVSVSRGEGNNKPAMEMMATGGTVMATDWSGHQNWLFGEATYPLAGEMGPVEGVPWAQDFHVDHDDLVNNILRIWRNPEEMWRKQMVAPSLIRSSLSWEIVTRRLVKEIERVAWAT